MVSSVDTQNSVDNTQVSKRVASASAIGTAAVLFFGHLFFPDSDPLSSTLAAFATCAVGLLARPLGAIVFGHIGDKVGRKKALVITILIVGLGTFCIGLLPACEKTGIWAPVLLILILGIISVIGLSLMPETAPVRRKGEYHQWGQH